MRRWIGSFVIVAAAAGLGAAGDKISWEKPDAARARAPLTGKPILWYFNTNEFDKNMAAPTADVTGKADQAFQHDSVLKRRDQYHWVRADQNLANDFKIKGAPAVVITDPDGEIIHRASIVDAESLLVAMISVVKEKWVNVPVQCGNIVRTGPIKKKLLVVGFDDGKDEALKVLEDRTVVKYHKHCEFVRLNLQKDAEAAKKWGVTKSPTIVICDASETLLEKSVGRKSPPEIRVALQRALKKADDPKK